MAHRAGQSGSGTTGEARTGGAELWTDAAAQRRFVNLWKAIAARYAGSEVIAGDGLLNEPASGQSVTTDILVDLYDRAMTAIRSVEGQEPHVVRVERIQNACNFKGAPSAVGLAQMKAWGRWVQSDHLHTPWCDHPPDPTGHGAHPLRGSSGMPCPMFKAGMPFDAAQGSLSSLDSAAPEPRWMVNPGYRDLFARFGTPPTAPSPGGAHARSEVCARPGEGRLTVIVSRDGNGAEVL